MNELAAEWLQKAEGDYATAGRETRARRHPNYDAACFHAQQAAEKYLKAFVQDHGLPAPRTHNLVELVELCLPLDAGFEFLRDLLILLDGYSVRYRYPGESANKDEARTAFKTISLVRAFMRPKLESWQRDGQ
jgi:HEPN domain-containing protein